MARKSKEIRVEYQAAMDRLVEIEKLQAEAEAEENNLLVNVGKEITDLAERNNMFCGVVLTPEDISAIVQLAIKSKEDITIPFKLYYKP